VTEPVTSIDLTVVHCPDPHTTTTYSTQGLTLDLMINVWLPNNAASLREKIRAAGHAVPDGLAVGEYLIIMAALYDEGITLP
jgi:hypothetical protein